MAKEQEEWQFVEEGQWQTADKRFTIVESQSGEYHHLVDNQRLRNSKSFKSFAECDEYAGRIRAGLEEGPSVKKARRQDEDRPEQENRQRISRNPESAAKQPEVNGGNAGQGEKNGSRAEHGTGGGRNRRRQERQEKEGGRETARTQGAQHRESAGNAGQSENGGQSEKNTRRRRHHRRSRSPQQGAGE